MFLSKICDEEELNMISITEVVCQTGFERLLKSIEPVVPVKMKGDWD